MTVYFTSGSEKTLSLIQKREREKERKRERERAAKRRERKTKNALEDETDLRQGKRQVEGVSLKPRHPTEFGLLLEQERGDLKERNLEGKRSRAADGTPTLWDTSGFQSS